MTRELIEACIAAPDDDAPRLVWADAVGGDRGEFVVLQCALARGNLPPADAGRLRRRQRDLLHQHGAEWSQLKGIATRVMFHRGFVEAAEIDCGRFVDDNVLDRAPLLRTLTAAGLRSDGSEPHAAMPKLEKLFRSPMMQRLAGLNLLEPFHKVETDTGRYLYETDVDYTHYGDAAIRLAVELGVHVRAFSMKWARAMLALRETKFLRTVERLWLEEECSTDDIVAILDPDVMPALTALDLGKTVYKLDQVIPRLPRQLRELHVRQYSDKQGVDAHVARLAEQCPDIERLSIDGGTFRDPSVLHAFPKLRSLSIKSTLEPHGKQLPPLNRFLSRPMPALRELAVFSNLVRKSIDRVLDVLGPQLEWFDSNAHMKDVDEQRIAGVVKRVDLSHWEERPLLFHTTREPDGTLML